MPAWPRVALWLLHRVCRRGVGWRLGLGLRRMEKRLARPISKAEELSFYPAGDK